MVKKNYPAFSYLPHRLSEMEAEDPHHYLSGLFRHTTMPKARNMVQGWMKLTLSSTYHKQHSQERIELLEFYDELEKIIEAAHVLYCRDQIDRLDGDVNANDHAHNHAHG